MIIRSATVVRYGTASGPQLQASPVTLPAPSHSAACAAYLGIPSLDSLPRGVSLILTADPGDFSGTPEAHHILANLRHQLTKPRSETVCGGVVLGSLMGQDVLVVTTGIGPTAAGLCVQELLTPCGPYISEMIYFGTSGWSPQLGGVLSPPDCDQANDNGRITRVGDVCISPVSVNWVCKKSTWVMQSEGFPNQCFRPEETEGPNATALYGECLFATDNLDGNLALSDALIGAVRTPRGSSSLPYRNELVAELEARYWGLMSQGTGLQYPQVSQSDRPGLWNYTQCAEVDGQFFFTGAPWEIKARDYAAQAIATALVYGKRGSGSRDSLSAREVIAVSAMEGVGVAEALEKYHRLSTTKRRIPYTNVRTLSNWVHQPVGKVAEGEWRVYQEVPEDYVNGYAYAIATGSATIMSLFQQRCLTEAAAAAARRTSRPALHGLQEQRRLLLLLRGGGDGDLDQSGEGVGGVEEVAGGRQQQPLGLRLGGLEDKISNQDRNTKDIILSIIGNNVCNAAQHDPK
ncbi:hypothetical protein VOLCADRAFT_89239 [Volvox carteri f. nagariensis]|uniref:Nucleoside phosphorylase domain-containing protein n=1 Tax=Volvox carteri f. nagariensis TaxID=3068 RepID=D8TR65_VOLCA|nr:uncharacterized protein VOLCADRAFT_89239 [Volvox carteri f. nagariensis]EFJ50281.1 hypothetical protein VOLCADRAFT_89239 [Volvox carteri f. nagariensis]|eukprot:XP_002948901.1 hypothetical protein VOLCADRAFT_89239 [Volvox carteri f. nagariensis]